MILQVKTPDSGFMVLLKDPHNSLTLRGDKAGIAVQAVLLRVLKVFNEKESSKGIINTLGSSIPHLGLRCFQYPLEAGSAWPVLYATPVSLQAL